jgi:ABC-type branched-subunit amino acid transport system ATPase component
VASESATPRSLEVRGVSVSFSGLAALESVDLYVDEEEILGLIGPNGAGKSTMVNVISGFQRPDRGEVILRGREVTGKAPAVVARAGLGRTFQAVRLFPRLSVLENIEIGGLGSGLSRKAARARAHDLTETHDLGAVAHHEARSLSYGDERRLALARALAGRPSFLLLDEPAAGLDERETDEMLATITQVRADLLCGILVVEHDMGLIMRLCDRIQVLASGRTLCIGRPTEVQAHPAVIEAYLGADAQASTDGPGEAEAPCFT